MGSGGFSIDDVSQPAASQGLSACDAANPLLQNMQLCMCAWARWAGGLCSRNGCSRVAAGRLHHATPLTPVLSWVSALARSCGPPTHSAADIPLQKAVAGARVGLLDGQFVVNPTAAQMAASRLDLVMAGTADAVLMIEGYCDFLSEAEMLEVRRLACVRLLTSALDCRIKGLG